MLSILLNIVMQWFSKFFTVFRASLWLGRAEIHFPLSREHSFLSLCVFSLAATSTCSCNPIRYCNPVWSTPCFPVDIFLLVLFSFFVAISPLYSAFSLFLYRSVRSYPVHFQHHCIHSVFLLCLFHAIYGSSCCCCELFFLKVS